jgi:hypothetical protein
MEKYARKWAWLILGYCPIVGLELLKKIMKNLSR